MFHADAAVSFFDSEAFGAIASAVIAGVATVYAGKAGKRRQAAAKQFEKIEDSEVNSVVNPVTGQLIDVSGTNSKILDMFFDFYHESKAQADEIEKLKNTVVDITNTLSTYRTENQKWHDFYTDLDLNWSEHRVKNKPPTHPIDGYSA